MLTVDVALVLESVQGDLAGMQTVVIDVLRASSTMVAALLHDVPYLVPVASLDDAKELAARSSVPCYLGGERNRAKPSGFDFGNSPLEYTAITERHPVIYTTTNGTRALHRMIGSSKVLVGSMLNAKAVAKSLLRRLNPVLLVCSGTKGEVAAEDVFCAGLIIDTILQRHPVEMTDTACVAYHSYLSVKNSLPNALSNTRSGRALTTEGFGKDVVYCSQVDITEIVPQYDDGRVFQAPGGS